jgi:hypothetical protein
MDEISTIATCLNGDRPGAQAARYKMVYLQHPGVLTFNNLLNRTIKMHKETKFPIVLTVLVQGLTILVK